MNNAIRGQVEFWRSNGQWRMKIIAPGWVTDDINAQLNNGDAVFRENHGAANGKDEDSILFAIRPASSVGARFDQADVARIIGQSRLTQFKPGDRVFVQYGYDVDSQDRFDELLDGVTGQIQTGPHGDAYDVMFRLSKGSVIARRIEAKWLAPAPPDPPADPPGYTRK